MKIGDKKLFENNPVLLQEMLELKKAGWSIRALGRKYHCDRSSIRYQYRKAEIRKLQTIPESSIGISLPSILRKRISIIDPIFIPKEVIPNQREYADGTIEKVNPGHDYNYYLQNVSNNA